MKTATELLRVDWGLKKEPLLGIVAAVIAIIFLYQYWHQVSTEKLAQQKIDTLQAKLETQERTIEELSKAFSGQSVNSSKATDLKRLNKRLTILESGIENALSDAQATQLKVDGVRSDLETRVSTLEAGRADNRFLTLEARLIDVTRQVSQLEQLIGQ